MSGRPLNGFYRCPVCLERLFAGKQTHDHGSRTAASIVPEAVYYAEPVYFVISPRTRQLHLPDWQDGAQTTFGHGVA